MAIHPGRVIATDERNYVPRSCTGTLAVEADRLVIQGEPHRNGRARRPVAIERAAVATLELRCGAFGATLRWRNVHGYRNHVIRVRQAGPLLADLETHAWPVELTGWRRPRRPPSGR